LIERPAGADAVANHDSPVIAPRAAVALGPLLEARSVAGQPGASQHRKIVDQRAHLADGDEVSMQRVFNAREN
jgi:hypothetical protein